ncbi:MAG: low molecular weight protein-tyrosine-phosphatase [Bacteroidia bacterium]|nr:low molecular weight protein-tyrosine-phosphatase [Bacteroidia bacterium]
MEPVRILFVCLGNICRSPMAEGIFQQLVREAGLESRIEADSCGTGGWHVGELPDRRTRQVFEERSGEALASRARQIQLSDFDRFDYILAMDEDNRLDLQAMLGRKPGAKARIFKMRHFDPEAPDANVPDPYYGGIEDFEAVYDMLLRSNREFLGWLRQEEAV